MSTRQHPLSLHRLAFVSTLNQDLVADYLAHLRTRHYSAKTLQTTLGALVTFYRLLPPARQSRLWEDVTRLTPADVDAWLEAAQRKGLAPSTLHSLLSVVRRFCTFLQEQGLLARHPIHPRRHAVLLDHERGVPQQHRLAGADDSALDEYLVDVGGAPSPKPLPGSRCNGSLRRSPIPWTERCFW